MPEAIILSPDMFVSEDLPDETPLMRGAVPHRPSPETYADSLYDDSEAELESDDAFSASSEPRYDDDDQTGMDIPTKAMSGPRSASRVRRNLKIARMLMDGMAIEEVADIMHLSRATVYRAMRTDEGVRHLVDATARSMASMLPQVKRNYEDFLTGEDKKLRLEASRDVLRNVSISPTANTNTTINNIVQNNTIVADSRAMEVLRNALRPRTMIDITPKPDQRK